MCWIRSIAGKLWRVERGKNAEGCALPEKLAVWVECECRYGWGQAHRPIWIGIMGMLAPVGHVGRSWRLQQCRVRGVSVRTSVFGSVFGSVFVASWFRVEAHCFVVVAVDGAVVVRGDGALLVRNDSTLMLFHDHGE